jgi:hypothetical protein
MAIRGGDDSGEREGGLGVENGGLPSIRSLPLKQERPIRAKYVASEERCDTAGDTTRLVLAAPAPCSDPRVAALFRSRIAARAATLFRGPTGVETVRESSRTVYERMLPLVCSPVTWVGCWAPPASNIDQ